MTRHLDMPRPIPGDVAIREAVLPDLEQLYRFKCANNGEPWTLAPELTAQRLSRTWIRDRSTLVLVAVRLGSIVGTIALALQPERSDLAISEVPAVAPNHRREYIGFNLKQRALECCAAAGITAVTSEVDGRNAAMLGCNALFAASAIPEPDDPEMLINAVRLHP